MKLLFTAYVRPQLMNTAPPRPPVAESSTVTAVLPVKLQPDRVTMYVLAQPTGARE